MASYRIVTLSGRGLPSGVDCDGYDTRLAAEAMAEAEHDGEYRIEEVTGTIPLGDLRAQRASLFTGERGAVLPPVLIDLPAGGGAVGHYTEDRSGGHASWRSLADLCAACEIRLYPLLAVWGGLRVDISPMSEADGGGWRWTATGRAWEALSPGMAHGALEGPLGPRASIPALAHALPEALRDLCLAAGMEGARWRQEGGRWVLVEGAGPALDQETAP